MRYGLLTSLLASLLTIGPLQAAPQSNYEREQRMADEIVDVIFDGDAVWLKDGEREFLGIFTEAEEVDKAVVILHGRGTHPDWQDVANPLRVGLVEHGWATLSLQMPVLEKDAKYFDYLPLFPASHPRIETGINYLREQGYNKVVLIAHSCGVHMAMTWVDAVGDASIDGFVGIGMGATDYQQPMPGPFPLAKMKVPVLDIYGDAEYPAVIRGAPERLQAIQQAGNPQSQQRSVPDANHYFTDMGEPLTEAVGSWLNALRFE